MSTQAVRAVQAVLVEAAPDMGADEARSLVLRARRNAHALRRALLELRERGGHLALGYTGWEAFVKKEFGLLRRQAYWHLAEARAERDVFGESGAPPALASGGLRALASVADPQARREVWQRAAGAADRPTIELLKSLADAARSGDVLGADAALAEAAARDRRRRRDAYRRQRLAKGLRLLRDARELFAGTADLDASEGLRLIGDAVEWAESVQED